MHKIEGLIDFIQRHRVGNKWLQFNFTLHGIFYHGRKLRTAFSLRRKQNLSIRAR
ncbi:Uncharacterised protein [Klebsiella aerogenes]|nr:Uncharacterised protein [Klebsiella aerogenes]